MPKTSPETCAKKRTFDCPFDALRAAESEGNNDLGAYKCNVCNKFHLTSYESKSLKNAFTKF